MTSYRAATADDLAASTDLELAARLIGGATGGMDGAKERTAALLADHDDALVRTCRPGHLTGSAFVIDHSGARALLLFHTKLQRWLQPGGHADGDANLATVALREATEETGIEDLEVWLPAIDIDIHRVDPPKEDPHDHHDVRFVVRAPREALVNANHESQGDRWVTLDELEAMDVDEGLRRMARRSFALAAGRPWEEALGPS